MNKYSVSINFGASASIDIEAESPDEAAQLAYESDKAYPGLCHQCAKEIDLGDACRVIVYDENDNDVFDDCFDKQQITSLQSQLANITKQRDDLLAAQHWQPIETAPKDGTELLVFTKELGQMVVAWYDGYWREKANFLGLKNEPTHWMPLPDAPAIANVKGEAE